MKKELLELLAMFPAVGFTAVAVYGTIIGLKWEVLLLVIAIPLWVIAAFIAILGLEKNGYTKGQKISI